MRNHTKVDGEEVGAEKGEDVLVQTGGEGGEGQGHRVREGLEHFRLEERNEAADHV